MAFIVTRELTGYTVFNTKTDTLVAHCRTYNSAMTQVRLLQSRKYATI